MTTLTVFTVKRFCVVNGTYWTYGGFGDYVRSLLPHFDKVVLACHPRRADTPPKGWYPLQAPNLEFHWLPYYMGELGCLAKLPAMVISSRAAVRDADVVNARVPDYSGICGAFWARWYSKPLFISIVDNWHGMKGRQTRLRGLLKFALTAHYAIYCFLEKAVVRGKLIFAQGQETASLYKSELRAHECISSSHYDSDVLPRPRPRERQKEVHIVSVGRLVHVKGHADLIYCLKHLVDTDTERNYTLSIAGEGGHETYLRQLAERLQIAGRVAFLGQLDRASIFELYDKADVFCLPSLREGTPKVVLEAMARGAPVVATDVGGVGSVVKHMKSGMLVGPSSPKELAAAIHAIASDPQLCHVLASAGLDVARKHTVEREWGQMIRVVRNEFPALFSQQ